MDARTGSDESRTPNTNTLERVSLPAAIDRNIVNVIESPSNPCRVRRVCQGTAATHTGHNSSNVAINFIGHR